MHQGVAPITGDGHNAVARDPGIRPRAGIVGANQLVPRLTCDSRRVGGRSGAERVSECRHRVGVRAVGQESARNVAKWLRIRTRSRIGEIALVPDSIGIGVDLSRVRSEWTIVARVAEPVLVSVRLVRVRREQAVVDIVADAVPVRIVSGVQWTGVESIGGPVAVRVVQNLDAEPVGSGRQPPDPIQIVVAEGGHDDFRRAGERDGDPQRGVARGHAGVGIDGVVDGHHERSGGVVQAD